MAYPKTPTSIIGPTSSAQPLDIAIAAAVVGPPILAFEESIISSKLKFNILPKTKVKSMFIKIAIKQKTNKSGEFFIISFKEAGHPTTKKNK